jgi:hypothetical protein
MRLHKPESAVVEVEKVRDYLLSTSHPVGRMKATFFLALGYLEGDWPALRRDLLDFAQLDSATPGRFTRYGNKYEVRGTLKGPSGRAASLQTVWIVRHGEDFPRFITAFPGDES